MTNSPTPPAGGFRTTRWTLVLQASGQGTEAHLALGELCEAYWHPVFRFLRGQGKDEDSARELAQAFFARVLAGGGFGSFQPGRGRFRSYLLGALKHFLADQRKGENRQKRGGGAWVESLNAGPAQGADTVCELQVADPSGLPPDSFFDREWALTVMQRALEAARREYERSGREADFDALKPWLIGQSEELSSKAVAAKLGSSEGAVKVAIHRLRKRFRELVRTELEHTVSGPGEVDEELRYFVEVLAAAGAT